MHRENQGRELLSYTIMVCTIIEFPTMQYMNSLYYVTLLMDGAYGTRFVQFTHFFTNHYVHHARTSCKYIHVPTYLCSFISFFSTAIEMLFMLYHAE